MCLCVCVLIAQCQRDPTLAKWAWHGVARRVAAASCRNLSKIFRMQTRGGIETCLTVPPCTYLAAATVDVPVHILSSSHCGCVPAVPHTNRHTQSAARTWLICLANNGPKSLTIDRFPPSLSLPLPLFEPLRSCGIPQALEATRSTRVRDHELAG